MSEGLSANSPQPSFLRNWAGLCLLNLLIVSILGVLLRYKGALYMPFLNYQYLLNAHSHFAFTGWVTTALFTALVYILSRTGVWIRPSYRWIFRLNQLSSFGMLISFTWEGYAAVSIAFSALSVIVSYWFAFRYWRDLREAAIPLPVIVCIRFALLFLVLSSSGPYLLGYSMSHHIGNRAFYFNAIYLYLHFQYNGWFSLGVLGLLFWVLLDKALPVDQREAGWVVWLFGGACVPAYCLSLLWTAPPLWVWVTAAIAAVVQLAGLVLLAKVVWKAIGSWSGRLSRPVALLWGLCLAAFAIKILLQAGSVIPSLGRFAFSFRPVIIAYLHLVLLCFVTFFLIGFFSSQQLLNVRGSIKTTGLTAFITGVLANEFLLLLQSFLAMGSIYWSTAAYYLLGAAMCIFAGLLLLQHGKFDHDHLPA
jgi:hypothetical protein